MGHTLSETVVTEIRGQKDNDIGALLVRSKYLIDSCVPRIKRSSRCKQIWVKSRIVGISMGPQPEALKFVGIENIEGVPLFEDRFLTDQVIY